MNILVTGGTVFASRFTAEFFASRGHSVYVLNRGSRPQSEGVIHLKGDRHNAASLLKNINFDAVLDITAYNEHDVRCLLDSLGNFGTYILISSSAVYPETLPKPFREDAKCGRNTIWGAYGLNKIAAEHELFARVRDAYVIRPPYLYGPMNNLYREAFVFECALGNRPFYVPKDGSMKLQFFHIADMCRLMEKIIETRPEHRIFNVGEPVSVDVLEWVNKCYAAAGKTPEIRCIKSDIPQRSYFPFYDYEYELNVTRMMSILPDLKPLSIGLKESFDWWCKNRELIIRKPLINFIDNNFDRL
ncbi:MAG: NAD-dependent epimerase/dehydratase family protein [Ruminococcus flavefaciens]|jgi:nucleoside-diphosphate-sugar epimerase|nr:NAD-dependent epimerase/dehydratase family protein [Ruminococcus flavefaciens]